MENDENLLKIIKELERRLSIVERYGSSSGGSSLPDQTGHDGEGLATDGANPFWKDFADAESLNGFFATLVGLVLPYAGATAPDGFLLCQGQAVSRTTYANLFAIIGTTYGVGNGTTTFNLPDLKGRVPVGKSTDTEFDVLGETGGAKTHTLTTAQMPSHNHIFGSTQASGNSQVITGLSGGYTNLPNYDYLGVNQGIAGGTDGRINIKNTGGGESHNNIQPYITLNYIIRY